MTTYYCVSSLPLPYGIHVTTITLLRTTVWAVVLALRHTRYYYFMTTYYCVSSLPMPYGIRVTTITWLRTTVWAACPCPTSYALLLLHYYVLLCEQLALALWHTRYYYYITKYYCVISLPLPYGIRVTITYYCVSSLPLPYGIRVTTIKWLRTTVWEACPCPTAYTLLLLHHYVLLCEQPALALRHTRY